MIRVLVFGITENPGGVESFLIGYYRRIDRSKIQFDFLCNTYETVAYEEELKALGGRIFKISPRSSNPLKFKKELNAVFKEHAGEWNAVWVNVCSLANIDYLKTAKKYGIKRRIIHSHNSENMDSALRGRLHEMNKKKIDLYATDFWACSKEAAKWFYKEELLDKAVIIKNAIDVERVRFDEEKREKIRKELGADNRFVIGNIGRLHFQKNQMFALDVFKEYLNVNPNAMMVFVGEGEDRKKLEERCTELEIADKVRLVGIKSDIGAWLSAFDVFFFPSVFEGLSIALLEAQANGVPVLASKNVIPKEVRLNENFVFADLKNDKAGEWAALLETARIKLKRVEFETVYENFKENGYEITAEAKKLEEMLL